MPLLGQIERALVKELEWALVQGGKKEEDDVRYLLLQQYIFLLVASQRNLVHF